MPAQRSHHSRGVARHGHRRDSKDRAKDEQAAQDAAQLKHRIELKEEAQDRRHRSHQFVGGHETRFAAHSDDEQVGS